MPPVVLEDCGKIKRIRGISYLHYYLYLFVLQRHYVIGFYEFMCECTFVCLYVHMYSCTCTYVCLCACMYVLCVYVAMYTCMHAYMYVLDYTHTHTHVYTLSIFLNKIYRYTSRVAPSISNRVVEAARGWLNKLVPDVYIYTDLAKKKESKRYVSLFKLAIYMFYLIVPLAME